MGGKDGDHYDLFLEEEDHLRTWRLERPTFDEPQEAVEIAPHRKRYLDYEGEISDGRGRVRIVDAGTYDVLDRKAERLVLLLAGRDTPVTILLAPEEGSGTSWRVVPHA